MMTTEHAVSARQNVASVDPEPRFVDPWEFVEEPALDPWPGERRATGPAGVPGVADMPGPAGVPGAAMAAALAATDPRALDDDELLSAISAWHRLGAWAKAGELASVAAFLRLRSDGRPGPRAFEAAVAEIELELTLTGVGSTRLLELAVPLSDRLPATMRALRDGVIDEAKARVVARAVTGVLDPAIAGTVERQVLPAAPGQTTGQLRAAAERAVIAADPTAADRRRRQAEAGRRVELRATDAHTADLCGRDLPADQALAADNRITALATARKHDGDPHSLAFLRAQTFLSLLLGTPPIPTWPAAEELPDRPSDDTHPAVRTSASESAAGFDGGRGVCTGVSSDRRFGGIDGDRSACTCIDTGASRGRSPGMTDDACGIHTGGEEGLDRPRRRVALGETGRPVDRPGPPDSGKVPAGTGGTPAPDTTCAVPPGAGGHPKPCTGGAVPVGVHAISNGPSREPGPAAGGVHVIIPIDTLCGAGARPGEVPGFGPVPAPIARSLAARASGRRWCYTVTDATGRALAHGHMRASDESDGRRLLAAIAGRSAVPVTDPVCPHTVDGDEFDKPPKGPYRPRGSLRHLVETRDRTCRFPGCRRPARACDLDHTIPYESGGPTCACNLAPLCRRHHQLKQENGWTPVQAKAGSLVWTTPSGRRYRVDPDPYLE